MAARSAQSQRLCPVSYTHLDVYKRQEDGTKLIGRFPLGVGLGFQPSTSNRFASTAALTDISENSILQAVSYTHLDVYKRQPVVSLRSDGQGTLRARQIGIDRATGPVLAFTDSDCVPDRGWLTHAMAAMDQGADMVHGHTRPTRALKPLERSVEAGDEGLFLSLIHI